MMMMSFICSCRNKNRRQREHDNCRQNAKMDYTPWGYLCQNNTTTRQGRCFWHMPRVLVKH
jgi:hypothetical protein